MFSSVDDAGHTTSPDHSHTSPNSGSKFSPCDFNTVHAAQRDKALISQELFLKKIVLLELLAISSNAVISSEVSSANTLAIVLFFKS
jgi:hypothetical protein